VTYFLDTSALVKRYHPEVGSSKIEAIFREHNRRIIDLGGLDVWVSADKICAKLQRWKDSPFSTRRIRNHERT
jgi:hypothetical protein